MDPDNIIDNKDDDLLNRNEFAITLSDKIREYKSPDPLTIGIYGSWGSGKFSLLKLTENILEKENFLIIHFEPWFFSTQDNLYLQFFKLLISKLKDEKTNTSLFKRKITPQRRIFKKPNPALQDYFNYIKDSSNELNNDDLFYPLNQTRLETYGSLQFHKKQCEEYFKDLGYKVIVIIDDIDRLTNNEISQIFTLVKSLANFKHFIYILSFDKEIVTKALNQVNSDDNDKYIDKIIQIPISIPQISESKMDELILNDISKIYEDKISEQDFNKHSYDFEELFYHLKPLITDIRDLKRYKNILNFYLNSFLEELNINDFFLILAIHLFEHDLFLKIMDNKPQLIINKEKFNNYNKSFHTILPHNEYKKIFEEDKWDYLKKTLIYLFPTLNSNQTEITYEEYENWKKNHRICCEDYFEKYFTLSLENYEISKKSLNQLIELNNLNEIFAFLTRESNLSYNHSLLKGFRDLIPEIPLKNYEYFIKGFMKAGDAIKIHYYSRKYFNWIFNDLFTEIKSNEECCRILKECIEYIDDNVLTISEYIYSLAYDHGLTGENNSPKSENDMIITKSQTETLTKLTINKIHKSSENKEFLKQTFLKDMLTYWECLEDKETVKKYVLENVKNNDEILSFLSKFQIEENKTKETHTKELVFDFEKLTTYHELNFYENKVNEILSIGRIDEKTKEFCERFIIQSNEFKEKKRLLFVTYCSNIQEKYNVLENWIDESDINWKNPIKDI